jgi:4-diphosphocytidyl-2-C-methyl-D-erythritol kinase
MPDLRIRGYAKINLTLDITSRRTDGYHLLRSVMQSVSLYDTLLVRRENEGIRLYCDDPMLPCDKSNTVVRAANIFYDKTGVKSGVQFDLHKGIPYEAGLGSGSAAAAAALSGLNVLYGNPLSIDQLISIGEKVGADVPFALTGGTCLAEGIGEKLTSLPPLPNCKILIAKPRTGISTKNAFLKFDELPSHEQPDNHAMVHALCNSDLQAACKHIKNVLEQVCPLPEVFLLKSLMLRAGALGAGMSGSGSSVFGIFLENTEDLTVKDEISAFEAQGIRFFWTHPISRGVAFGCLPFDMS